MQPEAGRHGTVIGVDEAQSNSQRTHGQRELLADAVSERESVYRGMRVRHQQMMGGKIIDIPGREPRVPVDRIGFERMVARQGVESILEAEAAIADDIRERREREAR